MGRPNSPFNCTCAPPIAETSKTSFLAAEPLALGEVSGREAYFDAEATAAAAVTPRPETFGAPNFSWSSASASPWRASRTPGWHSPPEKEMPVVSMSASTSNDEDNDLFLRHREIDRVASLPHHHERLGPTMQTRPDDLDSTTASSATPPETGVPIAPSLRNVDLDFLALAASVGLTEEDLLNLVRGIVVWIMWTVDSSGGVAKRRFQRPQAKKRRGLSLSRLCGGGCCMSSQAVQSESPKAPSRHLDRVIVNNFLLVLDVKSRRLNLSRHGITRPLKVDTIVDLECVGSGWAFTETDAAVWSPSSLSKATTSKDQHLERPEEIIRRRGDFEDSELFKVAIDAFFSHQPDALRVGFPSHVERSSVVRVIRALQRLHYMERM